MKPSIIATMTLVRLLAGPQQLSLQDQIRQIAAEARGRVSVACALPASTLNCGLNPHAHPPMQSVFKLPLALAVLHQVEQGKFDLDQPQRFLRSDRMRTSNSPLMEKYPEGEVDIPLRELLRLTVASSDNVAADILLRLAGGPKAIDAYVSGLGISGFHFEDNEAALHHNGALQYRNWLEPAAAVALLRRISDSSPLTPAHTTMLLAWMTPRDHANRLDGALPEEVRVPHRSGTSDVDHGVAAATNDIGLIPLPDGRTFAIAVFITDSRADDATRAAVIARIGRAVYDAARPR